ncbi:MAG: hypothetical protein UR80_C0018G0008 [Parcubacteria group bacterium GW2011_GWB1_35_5]|uniref:PilN domain-containing protein n=1 Tax=Candidatus Zambryskibacteria bacterium RIFCSPLOWO2_01_FULL_35_19 TaxID=1802757 RepID=A0A1G2TXB7_9BACT|nr:MAG: hypothetical protein UR50_C0003G0108 [Parcubacteria group bacterium GW2011_GWC1_34_10]KKP80811.1 MAG: hypothetical protein UR80_C0018G0008 [Parcubacteria group bacterium GW2011_GWB1_35_5]OHA86028.1 MAG: hypothetical protein A2726_01335 [Candidatus Zambryskibacteria bacterium RIFCSPHIGHO2_01_FULL_35_32]OHB01202.1 MAG: hypothetical protein A3A90_01620 [Candidatus Zambryskibacteria bacterium RIFCSPLOWO2_01_FULL_35_19]
MASNFQSSFIPKGSTTEEVFKNKKTGIAGILAVSLFVVSIVAAGGTYFYKGMIKNDIQNLQSQLMEAEKNIDKKTINEMDQFSKKLDLVKSIVFKHQVVSNFLDELAASTVGSVHFIDLSYGNIENGNLSVVLKGESSSYAAIALQEDIFLKNENFNSVSFSNLSLAEKGFISFDLNILVNPQLSIYSVPVSDIENTEDFGLENTEIDAGIVDIENEIDNIDAEINNILENE